MKIERITVCNIASLAGTHSVDFTKDPLRTAGLFSISGATGAGKSTLLDALCLALFDQTPRLNQVGRLADLTNGEKQNDTRMLLRRNTACGFAEVAFVGVDKQHWTARWSVRRAHNRPDGNLQNVEMALYRGHIAAGSQGTVEEGGRKTLVKEAIIEKIGLTFEQFTRAVLLAQNDFATFLKADDKQRAEILQALTGTESFEAISRAVFERYSNEKKEIEKLEAQRQGYQPLSSEARAEKEASATAANAAVARLESELKQREVCVEWFRKLAEGLKDVEKANLERAASVQGRDAAWERRADLKQTEIVAHAARSLREAERRATTAQDAATSALDKARMSVTSHQATLQDAVEKHDNTTNALLRIQQEAQSAAPLLKQARELDTKLESSQSRVAKTRTALMTATEAAQQASSNRDETILRKQLLEQEQRDLQTRCDQLAAYAPFVKEAATWLHRLEIAMTAESETAACRTELAKLATRFQNERAELSTKKEKQSKLQQTSDVAARNLKEAETVEREFDLEHLSKQRTEVDATHRVLTVLQQELNQWQKYAADAEAADAEIAKLETTQSQNLAILKQLQEIEVPVAFRDAQVSHRQLEIMRAAVDDHARRLRLSLQSETPCPVCGSESHPYCDHPPDVEAIAINAAKENCEALDERHDTLKKDEQRLIVATQTVSEAIVRCRHIRTTLLTSISEYTFSSADHPAVALVITLAEDKRPATVLQLLETNRQSREKIVADETSHREASKLVQKSRKAAEASVNELRKHLELVNELEKQHGVTSTKHTAAESAMQKCEERLNDAIVALSGLLSMLPGASQDFAAAPRQFRDTFAESTAAFANVQEQMSGIAAKLNEIAAVSAPLEDAATIAVMAQLASQSEHDAAIAEHKRHLQHRQQLFDGRPADTVEQELANRIRAAEDTSRSTATAKHDAATRLAEAKTTEKHASDTVEHTAKQRAAASAAMDTWLQSFNTTSSLSLTLEDIDRILRRDAAWMESERGYLKQLDERVTAAESVCAVHEQQLQKHQEQRPTIDEESFVLASVQRIQDELKLAKESQEAALEAIRSDNQRRDQNTALTQKLAERQSVAEPWLKLNELIGSKEGDKFRMIAQRRTLDVLLGYANLQLNQLAARYRLERLPESLNLVVIDCDMGDERRSVHSLSGGESFLVSLALALGLASLTSNRLPIESLFIDEGFGSLDPETLTIAMNALTHLEAQGRKVGIISHVTEMTDAIPVQIKIEKRRSGGASRIVIPGADPEWVSPKTDFEAGMRSASLNTDDSAAAGAVAAEILKILQREQQAGKSKVSTAALRKEITCRSKIFAAAQTLLDGKITVDGRSLRLA